ncbi:hypothetical protein WN944_007318 [Citrus x changshan-huyou]|uniref:Uncharacterized protein n=1 Tax=Citrus x changshan-huyou TaxID=2935761 RepID=A0AAP0MKR9_9ROSI
MALYNKFAIWLMILAILALLVTLKAEHKIGWVDYKRLKESIQNQHKIRQLRRRPPPLSP